MFWTVPLSIIRSISLYTQQWYMSYWFADTSQTVSEPVWHIPLLCVQRKTSDDGQGNCPKHVEFYSKNKFEKLVHLVGFVIRIYHDARSPERQILQFSPLITIPLVPLNKSADVKIHLTCTQQVTYNDLKQTTLYPNWVSSIFPQYICPFDC